MTTSTYVITLTIKHNVSNYAALNKYFNLYGNMYNVLLDTAKSRYNSMKRDVRYHQACIMPKGKLRNEVFNQLVKEYKFTEHDIIKEVVNIKVGRFLQLNSAIIQGLAKRAFTAGSKVRFGNAKRINFIRKNEMTSIEGKCHTQSILFKGNHVMLGKLRLDIIQKHDDYTVTALRDRIKYCRILRKTISGKIQYFVQLILEGIPPSRHTINTGAVGLDIGTQTIAISSDNAVKLLELAPNLKNIQVKKIKLQHKLDRQRRANNKDLYNEDGTIKKGRKKLIYSKSYQITKRKLATLQNKLTATRKQRHNEMANYILSLGDTVYVEKMNYQALSKRSKKTTVNDKTGRINKKKRFGKSIANKAPSLLTTLIDNKLKYIGKSLIEIDTVSCKASQYNHLEDTYTKKGLGERWNIINGENIQRDMYSAFLIANVDKSLKIIDRSKCLSNYGLFKHLHDIEISRLLTSIQVKCIIGNIK